MDAGHHERRHEKIHERDFFDHITASSVDREHGSIEQTQYNGKCDGQER
jgi:hypothetical protein